MSDINGEKGADKTDRALPLQDSLSAYTGSFEKGWTLTRAPSLAGATNWCFKENAISYHIIIHVLDLQYFVVGLGHHVLVAGFC